MATAADILRARFGYRVQRRGPLAALAADVPAPSPPVTPPPGVTTTPVAGAQCPAGQRYHQGGSRNRPLVGCVPEGLLGSQADLYLMSKLPGVAARMSASAAGAPVKATIVVSKEAVADFERAMTRLPTGNVAADRATAAAIQAEEGMQSFLKAGMFGSPLGLVLVLGAGALTYFLFGRSLPSTVVTSAPVPPAAVHGLSRRVRRRRRR